MERTLCCLTGSSCLANAFLISLLMFAILLFCSLVIGSLCIRSLTNPVSSGYIFQEKKFPHVYDKVSNCLDSLKLSHCLIVPPVNTLKQFALLLLFPVEDVSDLWPVVKDAFEERTPFKKAYLNNKTHSPVNVENLPVEFILTTDARLRSRFPQEQSVFWFREPYATVVLVTCEVLSIL